MTALERRPLEDVRRRIDKYLKLIDLRREIEHSRGQEVVDAIGDLADLDSGFLCDALRGFMLDRIGVRQAELEAELEALGFLDRAKAARVE